MSVFFPSHSLSRILLLVSCLLCSAWATSVNAQLTNYQHVSQKCFNGASTSINNSVGTSVGSVTFTPLDIPPGHRVSDVIIEIAWSKTNDGSCGAASALPSDLSHVGFGVTGPVGTPRYLAVSANTATNGTVATTSSFTGASNVFSDTIVFRDGAPSLLPAGLPLIGRDTVSPNADPLSWYYGRDPIGTWRVFGIDDPPSSGAQLCIHSYCITLVTCAVDQLQASCKQNVHLSLGNTGIRLLSFADLDSISDVSCRVKSISFSPSSITCADLNLTVPVTMTIQDQLDSVSSCVSMVTVDDTTAPSILNCLPLLTETLYLDATGRDTFWADSVQAIDNCGNGSLLREVRPFSGSQPFGPFIVFNCQSGIKQFRARVTDPSGNKTECRILVQVYDTVRPTAVCGRYTAHLTNSPNGAVTVSATQVDGGSFDVCPPVTGRWIGNQFDPPPIYTCADLGVDTVRLVVSDINGNISFCDSAIITIVDTIQPTAVCRADTLYLDALGQAMLYPLDIDGGSSDICGITSRNINGFDSLMYNCTHINAPQSVRLNVFDASNNREFCTAMVTVMDTFPPVALCRDDSVYVPVNGAAVVLASQLNAGTMDLCMGTNVMVSIGGAPSVSFSCSDIMNNPNQVTVTIADSFGNASTCVSNIVVIDTVTPTANCAAPTVYLNNSGIATLRAADLSTGSMDNCGGIVDSFVNQLGTRFVTFNCNAIFTPQPAELFVVDVAGSVGSCMATVMVEDTIQPQAICRGNFRVSLDQNGVTTVLPAQIDSNSTDNCGITAYFINNNSQAQYSCADLGTQLATLTVRDSSGNVHSCSTQIIVEDNFAPSISCQSITASLSNTGATTIIPNDVIVSASDNCGAVNSSFSTGSSITYDCDSVGPRIVAVVVTDNFGNTAQCVTTVFVEDTIAPIASCRPVPYTVQLDANGVGYVTGAQLNNGSTDLCGVERFLVNGADSLMFTCANIGTTSVTLTVLDSSSNQGTCVAQVTVSDPLPPTAFCRDTLLYVNSSGLATVTAAMLDASSMDNCSYTATINGNLSQTFNCSQIGTNTVQLTVTDPSGNIQQCPANVTIVDTIDPVAICVGGGQVSVYLDTTCFASVAASVFDHGSTDACGGSNLSFSVNGLQNASFNATNIGSTPTPVTLTVRDASNNTATCNTTVWVRDTIRPTAICQPDTLQLIGATVVLNPLQINAGSVDNCGTPILTINGQPSETFDCNNLGSNTVVLRAQDISDNFGFCTTTVYVEDVAPPTARCMGSVTLALDNVTNQAVLSPQALNNGSVDNCSIGSYGISQDTFDCNDVLAGPQPVRLYVVDGSGNVDSCTAQVIVEDTITPVARCQGDTLYFTGLPLAISPSRVDDGSSDNCTLFSYTLSKDTFSCPDIGLTTTTLTVTDQSGNSDVCTADILLLDTIAKAIAGPEQVLCNGVDSATMQANTLAVTLTGTWVTNTNATISNVNAPNASVGNLQPGDNVFYWVTSNMTCSRLSEDSVNLFVVVPSTDSAYAGPDTAFCAQRSIALHATTPLTSRGQWLQDSAQIRAGVLIADPNDPNTLVSGLRSGNSYLFVWELINGRCGPYDRDTVIITIDELPIRTAQAGSDVVCSPDSVNLVGSVPLMGTVQWTSPGSSIIRTPQTVATWVTAFPQDTNVFVYTLSNGACMNYSSDTVLVILDDVHPILMADTVSVVPDGTISRINVILNDVLPPTWTINLLKPIQTGRMVNLNSGAFEVDINEAIINQVFTYEVCNAACPIVCDTTKALLVIQPPGDCYTPTAFTPNDDGRNDYFIIPCITNNTGKAALYIFNRWGNLVYETDNYINDWDGTHRNQPLPEGTYFYILQIENKRPQNGSIELKR